MGYLTTLSQIWECLLSFGSQSFLNPFTVYEYKDWTIENYYFDRYFVWLWNLVYHFKKDIREQGAEEDIWTHEAGRSGRLNKTA